MFSIQLNISDSLEKREGSTPSMDESSINETLMEICNELNRYPKMINFSMSGFGKDWSNLNLDSDLCMFMEDMPRLVNFLQDEDLQEVQFGFPEQHLQRMLTVVRVPSGLKISCSDWLSASQELTEELIQPEDFKNLLHELVAKIHLVLDKVYPDLCSNRFFKEWLQQVHI
jgi:hypothetical protein